MKNNLKRNEINLEKANCDIINKLTARHESWQLDTQVDSSTRKLTARHAS